MKRVCLCERERARETESERARDRESERESEREGGGRREREQRARTHTHTCYADARGGDELIAAPRNGELGEDAVEIVERRMHRDWLQHQQTRCQHRAFRRLHMETGSGIWKSASAGSQACAPQG